MKKIISIILMAAILFGVALTTPLLNEEVYAATLIDGNYEYTVSSSKATLTKCTDTTSATITVPKTLGGYTLTYINASVFSDCTSLTSVTLPSGVAIINVLAFANCSALTSIIVDSANTSFSSVDGVLFDKAQTKLNIYPEAKTGDYSIPATVTSIPDYAFYKSNSLGSVTFPSSVTSISTRAFYFCNNLTNINVDSGNATYSSDNGVLFNKLKTQLILYPTGKKGGYTVPSSVTTINTYAFSYCSGLTSIEIPNSVTSIGSYAFRECNGLTSVTLPSSITTIETSAFRSCKGLISVTLPNSIISIAYYAFDGCSSLTNITLPSSITTIETYTFRGCSALANITLPNTITSIKTSAFDGCSSLTGITLPSSLTSIGNSVFDGCISLENITIPASVTSIGFFVFDNCSSLTSINVDSANATFISDNGVVFDKAKTKLIACPAGKTGEYSVPVGVTSIGVYGFSTCRYLSNIILPSTITSIFDGAFYECSGLTSINVPSGVTSINAYTFGLCSNLTSVVLPNTITNIYANAFALSDNITLFFKDSTYLTTYCNENSFPYVLIGNTNTIELTVTSTLYDAATKNTSVSVKIANSSLQTINGFLLIAIYDKSGKLVRVGKYAINTSYPTLTINKTLMVLKDLPSGSTVKAMMWNNTGAMTPIAVAGSKTIS